MRGEREFVRHRLRDPADDDLADRGELPRRRALRRALRGRAAVHRARRPEQPELGDDALLGREQRGARRGNGATGRSCPASASRCSAPRSRSSTTPSTRSATRRCAGPEARADGRRVAAGRAGSRGRADPNKILEVRDLSVAYASERGPVVAVDHVDFDARPRRVPRHRRRVGLRQVDAAVRDRAAARRAARGRDHRRQVLFQGRDMVTLDRAASSAHIRWRELLGRDAERDERAQPGADRRGADARRAARPTRTMSKAEIEARSRGGAAARLDRPGAPAQLPAPALGRHAPAGDDRDGAPVHARADHHGRADLGARRRRPALADGRRSRSCRSGSASPSSSSRTTCRSSATSPTGCS